ncbi:MULTISPECIES: lytic transglycosylase domain-containing protein [unclassified Pseudoalteromonas]|uniref:lytic transglycosylase domain-containing protein n=1 Tax=unclassified Pseudoalteromonas TaxID=194690 RepID=UPI00131A084E|nr:MULTISPECIES: lytic transglycosylase domain-containing protein [unclassified Pseudoalteromonas]
MERPLLSKLNALKVFVLFALLGTTFAVQAQSTIYHYYNQQGIAVFTDAKPKVKGFEVVELKCDQCDQQLAAWHRTPLYTDKYHQHLVAAAKENGIDLALLKAIVHAESNFNPKAESNRGAKGLMQLMPLLIKEFNINDPFDPAENIAAGSAYFAHLLKRFKGNAKLAAAAYNAGPSRVVHYGGVPPFKQTRAFVQRIDILRNRYRQYSEEQELLASQLMVKNDTLEQSVTSP